MGVPSGPATAFAGRAAREALGELVSHAKSAGRLTRGHHNLNYIVPPPPWLDPLANLKFVMVRERQRAALPVVIRTWQDEAEILKAISGALPHVPQCLLKYGDTAVMSYVDGVPLSSVCPNGKRVDQHLVRALAELLADMTQVGRKELPPLPQYWPRSSRDSRAFLRTLALATESQVRQRNWRRFGGLFAMLGIPEDAMVRFAERVPAMISRPFSLLHTDLHRDNVIVSYEAGPPLICVDWELSSYGDPLHDLATHLVRMGYPGDQWDEAVDAWRSAMVVRRPKAVNGLERDLRHYVAFERAQSVYPDVMRAATSLGESFDQKDLDAATEAVFWALQAAEEPLRLKNVPDEKAIERILFRWNVSHGKRHSRDRAVSSISWERDKNVPEHPKFPATAVQEALFEEGAASAERVFKGTAHLSTAVRVEGVEYPVMVRRKVAAGNTRERRFLNEHVVLRAIEDSGVAVRAPRVLALGISELGDQFTIHSFEGPEGEIRAPAHPEGGLLPHEADDLVNQLHALTQVDCGKLAEDVNSLAAGFHAQLCDELIRMVSELPKETLQLAGQLGLPTSSFRLEQILGRHTVAPRRAVLLHGDLNPWNMIRREDGTGLTLIDWEMAMVGDPLYDLVRHMHLTPTLPEIRTRLFDRWSHLLPEDCTMGWRRDWRVYRWIETVRSAYVDLDRLVTRDSLEAPNVSRAVDTYAMTLTAATATLGLSSKSTTNPYLALALPHVHREKASAGN
ncbi:aminoglycoside phosphotransferase (APT) family kinase protein [Streptomyces sp. SAI-135]|uniref:aminoglycoside phosphotransferase family protein n=1 Tax=unclassified Streptomyces TaxID=2593676 RepID=UPI002475C315|nr:MULTISPECIES: aminoglycoside phosphotransferase family protein [unclassified Streptomyces]MDH6518157.1 aminoglycoside phosphotransferase (APT) family kinase protein [Streptomyces sp. SAI-090]MDH6569439.1 aminoglycoside phosphotransferase (APT) family kinase protein [Streptomyces sp. SAI-117]MDH6617752.1 aminoglycoside phosphotransferase (APT) family kinase protein [Streptomyces sp. SAI-135]